MSRSGKTGLDYFPFDIDFFTDEKIEFVSAKYEEKGELITVKLLCKMYRSGYYLTWGEDESLLFSKKAGDNINQSHVDNVIIELLKRDFFNQKLYKKYNILTSRGIQDRYFEATKRRKKIDVTKEYLLVDVSNYNVNILTLNANISTQSKVKKSKGKDSKEVFDVFWKSYPNKKAKGNAEKAWNKIKPVNGQFELIMEGLEKSKTSTDWTKDNGKYIPHPATWLNGKRWEDEHEQPKDIEVIVDGEPQFMNESEYKQWKIENPRGEG